MRLLKSLLLVLLFNAAGWIALAGQGDNDYTVIEVHDGATLRGSVMLSRPFPPRKEISVTEDADHCGTTIPDPTLIFDEGGRLKNVVVSLDNVTRGKSFSNEKPIVLANRNCLFEPHILLVPKGGEVKLVNDDPIFHTVHPYRDRATLFNIPLPHEGASTTRTLRREGVALLKCDAHSWMSGSLFVIHHPYYAVTDELGRFVISEIPPGPYTVRIWHEKLGSQEKTLALSPGETKTLDFRYASDGPMGAHAPEGREQ